MRPNIFSSENWREIGATLSRNKTRTFLTAFGIFWGTAMLAILYGGASGFEGVMKRNFAGFATNMGAILPNPRSVSYKGYNKGSGWSLTQQDVDAIRTVAPHMEYSSTILDGSVNASYGTKSASGSATGVEQEYEYISTPVIYEGRFLNANDIASEGKVTVIGRNIARDLFGDESPLGKEVCLNNVYYKVVGVGGQKSEVSLGGRLDDGFVLPSTTMRKAFNMANNFGYFVFTATPGYSPKDNMEAIKRVLRSAHYISPDDDDAIYLMDVSEMFSQVEMIFLGIRLLALFVGLGSLMAGIIGVGNIMWIVVKERTHEFGIRRAIGATPTDITVQVLSESIALTLVAGTAGVCFAAWVLGVADTMTDDPALGRAGFELPFGTALAIVGAFFVLGSLAGTLPAVKAMRIKPIEAINDK